MRLASRSTGSPGNNFALGRLALAVALLVLVLGAAPAHAKRVVLLGVDGPQSGKIESSVRDVLERKHDVVGARAWSKERKRLDATKPTDRNVARVAASLRVDAIVAGSVRRKGPRWSLAITVREGKTGELFDSFTVPLRGPRVDARARGDLAAKLNGVIARTAKISGGGKAQARKPPADDDRGGGGRDDDDDRGRDDRRARRDDDRRGSARDDDRRRGRDDDRRDRDDDDDRSDRGDDEDDDRVARGDEDEGDADDDVAAGDDEDDDDGFSLRKRKGRGDDEISGPDPRNVAADVSGGVSLIGRSLSFVFASSLSEGQQPGGYKSNPVPGVYVLGEVYPLAFSEGLAHGPLGAIGIGFAFDRVLFLKSRDADGNEFSTTQQRLGAGLRYRYHLGRKISSPTLKVMAGWNQLGFAIDTGDKVIDLPNVAYNYLDFGLGVRAPVGGSIAILGDLRYLHGLSAGEFGEQSNYGPSSPKGFELDLAADWHPLAKVTVKGGFRYLRLAHDFAPGAGKVDRDGDGMQDVGGAVDAFWGGYVTGGYVF